jgi:N-methylhydantoinase A/oxoprolinase/acetone carboxylase beta subunit
MPTARHGRGGRRQSRKIERKQDMPQKIRTLVIACGVLARDIAKVGAELKLTVGTDYLPAGLHERPDELRCRLQAAIDRAAATGGWDRIVVGYGVCGRGTVDIKAPRIPLVIPRVHDCISLFLGGDRLYQEQFKNFPGTYYISQGWYEAKRAAQAPDRRYAWMGDTRVYFDELVKKYGLQHAKDTFAFLESWRSHYQRAAFIDTGVDTDRRAEAHARELAEQNHWCYEKIAGSSRLLHLLLSATETSEEILVVPAGHITAFDGVYGRLTAHPVSAPVKPQPTSRVTWRMSGDASATAGLEKAAVGLEKAAGGGELHIGLGIDAGGTYTDAVIYDFRTAHVLAKSKALTTKWDFSIGIAEALAGLESLKGSEIQLVSVSTTLATNAIVENEGQKVGLLLMPPPGFDERQDRIHAPQAVLNARMDITGQELAPPVEAEVRRIARHMCDHEGVEAFAVSGYAGSINPSHELTIKRILKAETGCFVSCGHELSQMLNFRMRALTAVLNARIVPRLTRLLDDVAVVLVQTGINAPVMVVRGDGSLMSQRLAMQRPVETILSGPAASVAGARYLTGLKNAVVIDMGGTTTDIAALEDGRVQLCESGSQVGQVRTHVQALDIQTTGLGGDSLLLFKAGEWQIGPRRVAPVAWLGGHGLGLEKALDYLSANRLRLGGSTEAAQMFTLNHRSRERLATDLEERILNLLDRRPYSLLELSDATGAMHAGLLPLARLESCFIVQRCGLTPTDVLHAAGRFVRWDAEASARMLAIAAETAGTDPEHLKADLLHRVVRRLTSEIVHHQLASDGHSTRQTCPTCEGILENLLGGGGRSYTVHFTLHHPMVGVGAPIGHFLPEVAKLLKAKILLPEFHDVANAIGAITSQVSIKRQVRIKPDSAGGFYIEGLSGSRKFRDLDSADGYAQHALEEETRRLAVLAGTRETAVQLTFKDVTAKTARGEEVFIERQVVSEIQGRPDLIPYR